MFGQDKLPRRVHLATIWLVALGTVLSAAFIMAANSWMQHPLGYVRNPRTHAPELNNVWALFINPVFVWGYTKMGYPEGHVARDDLADLLLQERSGQRRRSAARAAALG